MKAITYIVCLLTMLLNVIAPSAASSWDMDMEELFPVSGLHFEQNRHDLFESITSFHFVATDETNDSADSENEDIDPSPRQWADEALPFYSHIQHNGYSLNTGATSLYAKPHTVLFSSNTPLYIQQRVLRL